MSYFGSSRTTTVAALLMVGVFSISAGSARAEAPAPKPTQVPTKPGQQSATAGAAPSLTTATPSSDNALAVAQRRRPWSERYPAIVERVRRGEPLVIKVLVPLCSNEQINCGARWAGQPGVARTNVYWGAIYGARTTFDTPALGWERLSVEAGTRPVVERGVYRRWVSSDRWGRESSKRVEQIVILQAFHGSDIDTAVRELFETAAKGEQVTFQDGSSTRTVAVSVVGYAGHNRLLDGVIETPAPLHTAGALPSFVLACISERYFGKGLRESGAGTLVMTRTYMAPEGYVIEALAKALGDNVSRDEARHQTVGMYARWQRLTRSQADWIFALPMGDP